MGARIRKVVYDKLAEWNQKYSSSERDLRFTKLLLIDIFGLQKLRQSTLHGGCEKNASVTTNRLSPEVMKLVQKIYEPRVKNNVARFGRFNKIVDKICRDTRKSLKLDSN